MLADSAPCGWLTDTRVTMCGKRSDREIYESDKLSYNYKYCKNQLTNALDFKKFLGHNIEKQHEKTQTENYDLLGKLLTQLGPVFFFQLGISLKMIFWTLSLSLQLLNKTDR